MSKVKVCLQNLTYGNGREYIWELDNITCKGRGQLSENDKGTSPGTAEVMIYHMDSQGHRTAFKVKCQNEVQLQKFMPGRLA